MFRALMAALLANGPDGTARAPGYASGREFRMDERGEGYARGDASVYNEMMTPKVGPGSRNEKRPLWLFKETGVTDMARELDGVKGQRGPGGAREKAGFAELSNEGIAQWLQEFRIRMNKSSVRFLASQDCTVLGAELYTKVAFDKLLKRASAITDDMHQEARMLRQGANGSELAHQVSLLLEDMVESTSRINSLAAVVHEIMLRRIDKLQEGRDGESPGSAAWLHTTMHATGSKMREGAEDSLVNLVSISGLMGELAAGVGGARAMGGEEEAARIRDLLTDMETAVAEGRAPAGGDHRMSAGKKDGKNPGAQMQRQQAAVRHNTLFGIMTSRLADATASADSKIT
mmetsp:Transcript_25387/g.60311  ORF Transcript_25387/g.60311 Transcript_25387/m.60311 type:complete len:346 (-) Transcript_25387:48-1085(-)